MYNEKEVSMVLRDVLMSNTGNIITEALGVGLEQTTLHYLRLLRKPEPNIDDVQEIE